MGNNIKKMVYSAIQPTGMLTIGNYAGAIQNWVGLQDEYDCIYSIADLHSLTLSMDGAVLRQNSISMYAMLMASGLNVDKIAFFNQSSIEHHASLAWILNCYTQYGEAKRMTQFKDKSARHSDNVNVGLFAYPILQAADILLYNANYVPVGQDQKQHIELARTIAERFNSRFGVTFNVPDVLISKNSGKISSLVDPSAKMSKSDDNVNSYILMSDDKATVSKKIKRAVTDSEGVISLNSTAGVVNLINIYSAFAKVPPSQVVDKYKNSNYGSFKNDTAEVVNNALATIQDKYDKIIRDRAYILECMQKGTEKAKVIADRTMRVVNQKIGIID